MAEISMVFILAGLAAYTVLAGADFGAGLWTLLAVPGRADRTAIRDHARHAMGPVWEANHVWLIFVLVVCWTAYPRAFGSITSTLAVPLFIAAVGIILRGASYALRGQLEDARGRRPIEYVFALSSILTPFALGTVAGSIASGRVPIGNANGNLVTSWLNPTSVLVGGLAVATGAYLAAVYLAADAHRLDARTLELDFRARALGAGICAGALAVGGLFVVRYDAPPLFHGLTSHAVGAALIGVSAAAGLATLVLVWRNLFGPARVSAALAVVAIVAGWAVAQEPLFLPGLTVAQAAAGHSTLVAVIIAVAAGAVVLIPSLILLLRLFLRGHLHPADPAEPAVLDVPSTGQHANPRRLVAFAAATLLIGAVMTVFGAGWSLGLGVVCLFACAIATFALVTGDTDN